MKFADIVLGVALLLIVAIFAWELRTPIEQLDDAFISYRYAQNLVDGYGLVFNVGERVEGYTNLLWVLLVALGIKLGFTAPIFGHWLCVATGALLLVSSYLYSALILPRSCRPMALLAPLCLLSFNCFVMWTSSGLEQGFFAALVILALCAATVGNIWSCCLCCILATLTRPEGALVAALLLNTPWGKALLIHRFSDCVRLMMPAVCYAVFLASLTLFRWLYYADIVPNTFHAKTGGIPFEYGVQYLKQFIYDGPGFLLVGVAVSAMFIPKYRMGFVLVLMFFIYVLMVRGDVFRNGRFMLPILPILIAGAIVAVKVAGTRHRGWMLVLLMLLPTAAFFSLYVKSPNIFGVGDFHLVWKAGFPYSLKRDEGRVHEEFMPAEMQKARIAMMESAQPSIRLIASVGIGKLGYYGPELRVLDLVGLIDKTIARSERQSPRGALLLPGHQRSNPDYVFGRNPDLIDIPKRNSTTFSLPAVLDLWNDRRLEEMYHWDNLIGGYRRNF